MFYLSADQIERLTWLSTCVRRFCPIPTTVLVVCIRQLHGVVDRLEYFSDSCATAFCNLPECTAEITQRLTMQKIIPNATRPMPTPNMTGNWNFPERADVRPPAMHKPMPPMMHRTATKTQTNTGIRDGRDLLILSMESRNSL